MLTIIHSKYYSVSDWLKGTRMIHHNQLLLTKFGRTLGLINRRRQKCSTVEGQRTVNREDLVEDLEVRLRFWLWTEKWPNSRRNILLFSRQTIVKKHSKKTTRQTTSSIWSIFADLNRPLLSSKHLYISKWT